MAIAKGTDLQSHPADSELKVLAHMLLADPPHRDDAPRGQRNRRAENNLGHEDAFRMMPAVRRERWLTRKWFSPALVTGGRHDRFRHARCRIKVRWLRFSGR